MPEILDEVKKGDIPFGRMLVKTAIVADHTIDPDVDFGVVVVAATANIVITLPTKASLAGRPPQRIPVTAIQMNGYTVKVQCGSGDSFHTGHTWFMVPTNRRNIDIGIHEHGVAILTTMNYDVRLTRAADWNATNFSSATPIEFDTVSRNTQTEMFTTTSNRITLGSTGEFSVTACGNIDSTGGTQQWNCTMVIRKNGTDNLHIPARGGNYQGEDDHISINTMKFDFVAGDYLELVIAHSNLTGNLVGACMSIDMMV